MLMCTIVSELFIIAYLLMKQSVLLIEMNFSIYKNLQWLWKLVLSRLGDRMDYRDQDKSKCRNAQMPEMKQKVDPF